LEAIWVDANCNINVGSVTLSNILLS